MTELIRGIERWSEDTRQLDRRMGTLKMRAGMGIVDALVNTYSAWKEKGTKKSQSDYMKWRVRLHRKWNSDVAFLTELNELFPIGLNDSEIGKTLWDVPPEDELNLSKGYNWRVDSGNALKGGGKRVTAPPTDA